MKTIKISLITTFALATCVFFSCKQSGQQTSEASSTDSTAVQTPSSEERTIAVVVSHHVHDFPMWRFVFDGQEQSRLSAQLKLLGMFQDESDPNYVSATLQVGDMDMAKQFLSSENLKTTMEKAGVTDQPEFKYYEFLNMDETAASSSRNRLFVVIKVPDFDAFSKEYAAHESLRKARGISTVAIARNIEDPSEVAVAETAFLMETLKKHVESPEVKEAMQRAGVIGEPYIQFAMQASGSSL